VRRARINLVALDETPKLHVGIGDLMEHFLVDQRGVVLASARQQPYEEEMVQRNCQRNSARCTQLIFLAIYAAGNTPCAASSRPSREQYSNIHTIATAGISASWTQSSLLLDAAPPDPLLPAEAAALPLAPGIVTNTCCPHHLRRLRVSMFADLFGGGKVRKTPRWHEACEIQKAASTLVKIRETHRICAWRGARWPV